MTVAEAKKPKKGKKEAEAEHPEQATPEVDLEAAAQFLKEECYSVTLEVSWFGVNRKATSAEKASMLKEDDDEADLDQLSVDLRLFAKDDPYIKAMNAAKTALTSYRDSVSMPSAKLPMTQVQEADEGEAEIGGKKRLLRKKPGERIIMAGDVDKFDEYVTDVLVPNLLEAVQDANANIEKIKDNSKKKLKKRFSEDAFPDKFIVGVSGPDYGQVGVSLDFEEACPSAAARMRESAEQRLVDTVELGVADFANTLMTIFETASEQMSHKTKLNPRPKHPLRKLKDGVVRGMKFHKDDHDIPEGSLVVEVEYKDGQKKVTEWFTMTEDEYAELNPYESQQAGKVYESTFERLLGELTRFEKIRDMLGDMGKPLDDIVQKARDLLMSAGSNAKQITNEVRQSKFFRTQGAASLAKWADEVENLVEDMPITKKARRRGIGKLKTKA